MRPCRGKSLNTGEWVYGWYVEVMDSEGDVISLIASVDTSYAHQNISGVGKWVLCDTVEVNPSTVGQQVGKQDINDKEIYKGDTAKVLITNLEDEGEFLCEVVWDSKRTKYKLVELPPFKFGENCGEIYCFEDVAQIEIIGNPGLLK